MILENITDYIVRRKFARVSINISGKMPLTIYLDKPINNRSAYKFDLSEIIVSEDLPIFLEKISEITNASKQYLHVNCRLKTSDDDRWYYFCCELSDKANNKHKTLMGIILDVEEYRTEAKDDPVLRERREVNAKKLQLTEDNSNKKISFTEIMSVDFLRQIQIPFRLVKGLHSGIFDEKDGLICTDTTGEEFDPSLFKYSKRAFIRVNRVKAASWVIYSSHKGTIDKNEPMLDVLALALSRIANSFVMLYNEMLNSERVNTLLSQNVAQQIFLSSVYRIIMEQGDSRVAIEKILSLIGDEFDLDRVVIYEDTKSHKLRFIQEWYNADRHNALTDDLRVFEYNKYPLIRKELKVTETYLHNGGDINDGLGANCYLIINLRGNGERYGVVMYQHSSENTFSAADIKILHTISNVLAAAIMRRQADTEVRDLNMRMSTMSMEDSILKIKNRLCLNTNLQDELDERNSGAVLFIKIVNLKITTELFGHTHTDNLLFAISKYLQHNISTEVYRFVGNILVILLRNENADVAGKSAAKIIERFGAPWETGDHQHYLNVGIGIALYPMSGDTCEEVFRAGSLAMNRAVNRGGAKYAFFAKEFSNPSSVEFYYAVKLRECIKNNMRGFGVYYQPIYSINGNIAGCEVFVRYKDGDDALTAAKLLRFAENIGFDVKLDTFVIKKACAFCRKIQEKFELPDFFVSVNTTLRELQSDAILSMLNNVLSASSLSPSNLWVEFPETCLARPWAETSRILTNLKKLGVKTAVDNFGTEHVIMSVLRDSCVNAVKIDVKLLTNRNDEVGSVIADCVTTIARRCDVNIFAKYVERKEETVLLNENNADFLQGHYCGKPMRGSKFEARLAERVNGDNADTEKPNELAEQTELNN